MRALIHRRRQRGYTLIELSVALLIGLFLLGGLLTMIQSNRRASVGQGQLAELQDNERVAMTMITDVVQSAGFFPDPITYTPAGTMAASTTAASGTMVAGQSLSGLVTSAAVGDSITVRYASLDERILNCNGTVNTTPGTVTTFTNVFTIAASADPVPANYPFTTWNALYCSVNGATPVELVKGLIRMDIWYGVHKSTATSANVADTYIATTNMVASDWLKVISVKVKLRFQNPFYVTGQPVAQQYIDFTRVIGVMNQTGVNVTT